MQRFWEMQQFREDSAKVFGLFNKAIYCSLSREKDDIIADLRSSCEMIDNNLAEVLKRNDDKLVELKKYEDKFEMIKHSLEDTMQRKKFMESISHRSTPQLRKRLMDEIAELSKKTSLLDDEYTKVDLGKFEKENNEMKLTFKLIDQHLKSLEDYIYALQRRHVIIVDGQESGPKISKEYGSITGLLDKYKRLLIENIQLVHCEEYSSKDKVIRRLPLSSMDMDLLRELAVFYQKEYETKTRSLERFHSIVPPKPVADADDTVSNEASLGDFDSLVKDPNFHIKPQDNSFLSASTSNLLKSSLKEDFTTEDSVKLLVEAKFLLIEEQKKMREQIKECKERQKNRKASTSRSFERLLRHTEQLFYRLSELNNVVDRKKQEILVLAKQLKDVSTEKNMLENIYSETFTPIKSFVEQHKSSLSMLYRDKQVIQALYGMICTFGLEVDDEEGMKYPSRAYIKERFRVPNDSSSSSLLQISRQLRSKRVVRPSAARRPTGSNISRESRNVSLMELSISLPNFDPTHISSSSTAIIGNRNPSSTEDSTSLTELFSARSNKTFDARSRRTSFSSSRRSSFNTSRRSSFTSTRRSSSSSTRRSSLSSNPGTSRQSRLYTQFSNFVLLLKANSIYDGMQLKGNKVRDSINEFRSVHYEGMKKYIKAQLADLLNWRTAEIGKIRALSADILIKERTSSETQTDVFVVFDEEIQVEEKDLPEIKKTKKKR